MKLYYSPNACSLAPHIILQESGLPFELEKVDLKTKQTQTGQDYMKINPKGYVPFLALKSGETLAEASVILQYIGDLVPQKKLIPAFGTFSRYHLLEWLNYISAELHKGLSGMFNPLMPEDYKPVAIKVASRKFKWVDEQLADKDYLLGDDFSVADAYLFTITRWCHVFKIDLAQWPALSRFMALMQERPAVKAVLATEANKA